jgi:hypothetical protein
MDNNNDDAGRLVTMRVEGDGDVLREADVLNVIVRTASLMLVRRDAGRSLEHNLFAAVLSTDFVRKSIADIYGVAFKATIVSEYGYAEMEFILARPLSKNDLEQLMWLGFNESEYDEYDADDAEFLSKILQNIKPTVH